MRKYKIHAQNMRMEACAILLYRLRGEIMCRRLVLSAPALVGNAETSRNDHGIIVVGRCWRHLLSEDKYAPGESSRWKHVSARFLDLYKAILAEPDEAVRSSMFKTAVNLAG